MDLSRTQSSDGDAAGEVARLQEALDIYLAWEAAPDPVPKDELLQQNASLRDLLEPLLDEASGDSAGPDDGDEPKTLGDFRLLREVGRGGMGVVYEAEQISLSRRVALKVLPPHLTLAPTAIARFKREALVAARLQHPNIVPIYSVGSADDANFIAMEFIDGCSLDHVLDLVEDQRMETRDGSSILAALRRTRGQTCPASDLDATVATGTEASDAPVTGGGETPAGALPHGQDGTPRFWSRGYVQSMLSIIVQIADALHHAYEHDIVHRDVKPGNILICEDGTALLADFGLAKLQALPSMTTTGQFAGTPKYVSPEQAEDAAHIDHRSDVYSLGASLYELLTDHPPFPGETAQEIVLGILHDEPVDPQRRNPALAKDLAAIVLKSLEKDPARRYQTAGEFAEDLRAFLEYRPVQARHASRWQRVRRWVRREPLKATVLVVATVAVVTIASLFAFIQEDKRRRQARSLRAVEAAIGEARLAQAQRDWQRVLDLVSTARTQESEEFVIGVELAGELEDLERRATLARDRVARERRNAELLAGLEDVRQPEGDSYYPVQWQAVAADYRALFRAQGLDLLTESQSAADAVAALRARELPDAILTMIDAWAFACFRAAAADDGRRLIAIVGTLDDDALRAEIRAAAVANDKTALGKLAGRKDLRRLSAPSFALLAGALSKSRLHDAALRVYQLGHSLHLQDFVLSIGLARALAEARGGKRFFRPHEAARFYYAALALKPDSVEVRHELGRLLEEALNEHATATELLGESVARRPKDTHLIWHHGKAAFGAGQIDVAEQAYAKLVELRPEDPQGLSGLAGVYFHRREYEKALPLAQKASRIEGAKGGVFFQLGQVLMEIGKLPEAEAAFARAKKLGLDTSYDRGQNLVNLGTMKAMQGRTEEAVELFGEARKVAPELRPAHRNFGIAASMLGRNKEAVSALRQALALDEKRGVQDPDLMFHLAYAYTGLRDYAAADVVLRGAFGLGKDAEAHYHVGELRLEEKRYEAAIRSFEETSKRNPKFAQAYCMKGFALEGLYRYEEALRAMVRGHDVGSAQKGWREPSAQWVEQARRAARLDGMVREPSTAANAMDAIAAAEFAGKDGRNRSAVILYERAFGLRASLQLATSKSYAEDAARAALRAASRKGRELDFGATEASALRGKALGWLRRGLAAWRKVGGQRMQQRLKAWQGDAAFAGVRAPARDVPKPERPEWEAFWREVAGALSAH